MSRALITGGAGFIGTNLADRLLRHGEHVVVFDDLSRTGARENLRWLQDRHGDRIQVEEGGVTDRLAVRRALRGVDRLFHFAAQVAVTHSITDPTSDFQVNAGGTLNVLEEMRRLDEPPALLFTSTNKVYGDLADVPLEQCHDRYVPLDERLRAFGVDETRPLSFCSPYGCSKGAADQYVLDFAKTYGLPGVVFRMSCIYGPHQRGTEDQGWVAHFIRQALSGNPIVLYGDGRQVRDVLFVEDLVDAMLLATDDIERHAGRVFNVGGGVANSSSLLEMIDLIGAIHGRRPVIAASGWRIADQKYYVSDTRALAEATGWAPTLTPAAGVERLYRWMMSAALDSPTRIAL